ncbi:TetR/AcrR family transcriptional regulator, partial [Actinoallomurus acaciae]
MTGRRDPEGRRRAIVDAACALIPEVGVGGLTHRAVAARAGVQLGSTTYHFATLDDLSRAALAHAARS